MKWTTIQNAVPEHIRKSAHIYRQICATVAASLLYLSGGISMGQSAVLFTQLEQDKTFPYDETLNSYVASSGPLAMIVGAFVVSAIIDWTGRKISQLILSVTFMIGWIIISFAHNNAMLLVGRFTTGICFGATMSSGMVFIAELTDPKYRPTALTCLSLSIHFGNLISHSVGKYIYWRYSCILFMLPNVITLSLLMFLKDSPLWLLYKDRKDEGIQSFRLYRGKTESSEKELTLVLQQHGDRRAKIYFQEISKEIFRKPFWKTLLIAFLLFVATQWNGVNMIPYYAEEIFQKIFSDHIDTFLLMVVSDCLRIVFNTAICLFSNSFPRRLIFLWCCFLNCLMLLAIAFYLYFQPSNVLGLALFCIIIYIGTGTAISSISYSTVAEIFSANILVRGFGYGLSLTIAFVLHFLVVKLTPEIIMKYSMVALYGTFALLTSASSIFLILLLPDTNNRTLQDIEDALYKKQQHDENNKL